MSDLPASRQLSYPMKLLGLAGALLVAGVGIHFAGASGSGTGGAGRRTLAVALALGFVAMAVQWLWPYLRISFDRARQAGVVCMLFTSILIAFLLPPFQGPDENAHWRSAVLLYRSNPAEEPALMKLPEILDTERICTHPDQKFNPDRFFADIPAAPVALPEKVSYASPLSYPVVGAVSFFFPRVQTLKEALLFYYLCRIVPALLLGILLFWLCRHAEVPFCALFFLSLPLVQQQFVVVTTDTLVNFAAIAAVLLTVILWRDFSWRLWMLLALITLVATYAKIYAGAMLLFPLLFLPYKRLPLKALTVPLLFVAAGIAIYGAMQVVFRMLSHGGGPNDATAAQAQIAALQSVDGLHIFLRLYREAIGSIWFLSTFSSWLGWLDTPLNGHHLFLIKLSAICAILLDAWNYFPRVPLAIQTRWKELVAGISLSVACFFIMSITFCAIMYISWTAPGTPGIIGVQARYYFPAFFIALLMPMLAFSKRNDADEVWPPLKPFRAWTELPALTLAAVVVPFLLMARSVELFTDLMQRFW